MPELPAPVPSCPSCASRDAAIVELMAANARLAERVAALERKAGRNSGNSSMPPSTDDRSAGAQEADGETGEGIGAGSR